MSLFKTRTFWSFLPENNENFDQNSLFVTNLDTESDFLISGSHEGILRIFKPSGDLFENNFVNTYTINDLLIEKLLSNETIIQIGCGKLVSGSNKTQLAVLQSHLLSIFSVVIKHGAIDHGTQTILQTHYEHKLLRPSANFTIGPFGHAQNRDFICVQSLDGLLSFYEQESFGFCCFLPDILLPSSIIFSKRSDSFITCNSDWEIISFKYKLLAEIQDSSKKNKNIPPYEWKYNLGEGIIDLNMVEDWILVLGERNLFCLSDRGNLKYMKKFDFSPLCFTNFILDDKIMSFVVTETNNLQIYQNTTLKWSSRLELLPVALRRSSLKTLNGVLTLLNEKGQLECAYLGTEPNIFVAPPLSCQNFDFDKANEELNQLNEIINKNSYDIKINNKSEVDDDLNFIVNVNKILQHNYFTDNGEMCEISVEINPSSNCGSLEEFQISLKAFEPIKIEPNIEFFHNINERKIAKFYAFIENNNNGIISSLKVDIAATFITNLGIPNGICKNFMLPLNLVMEVCNPKKEGDHKITLGMNQNPPPLAQLFPEFIGDVFNSNNNSIAFKFKNQEDNDKIVTILLAKSSDRFRIQSNFFVFLSLLTEQIISRLKQYFSDDPEFSIVFNSHLPNSDFFNCVNNHFIAIQTYNCLQEELNQIILQFRFVQKGLITKYKLKNPTTLSNFELLLQDTYEDIMIVTDKLEESEKIVKKTQIELSCGLNLILNLIGLYIINNDIVSEMLKASFNSNVYDIETQKWEDVMDVSLCYLLRTVLAKSEKDTLRVIHNSFEQVKDISKIEKHLSQVLERIPKLPKDISFEKSHDFQKIEEEKLPLLGREIGEASGRALSAKQRLLPLRQNINK